METHRLLLLGYLSLSAAQPTRAQSAATSASLSPASAPPVTVADLIGMTLFGSDPHNGGSQGDAIKLSPDGAHVAVVIQRGDVVRNTITYRLLLFRTTQLSRAPRPDTLATFTTGSNDPAIQQVRWLSDNATLAFVGMGPNVRTPQFYTVDTRTGKLTQRTHTATAITNVAVARHAEVVVYAAEVPRDTSSYPSMRARGFVVSPKMWVSDAINGNWLPDYYSATAPQAVHVMRGGAEKIFPLPDDAQPWSSTKDCELGSLLVAPLGDFAILKCKPRVAPAVMRGFTYQDTMVTGIAPEWEWVVYDLVSGRTHFLSPVVSHTASAAWAPDGRTVLLGNAMLPSTGPEPAPHDRRRVVAEVDVRTGAVTVVKAQDSLHVIGWDEQTGLAELAQGWWPWAISPTAPHQYLRKTSAGWTAAAAPNVSVTAAPAIAIDQGMNTPPRLVVIDPDTKAKQEFYEPNSGLFAKRRFAREEVVRWNTKSGAEWVAGLYLPPDHAPGNRYPLMIQTHGFDSTTFSPDGAFTTGEAAQPMANAGIVVVQGFSRVERKAEPVSLQEVQSQQEAMEGLIDALDQRGLIDRTKVGMQGFSRTCWYTLYFLTHSSYPVAAASVTDGVDQSYVQAVLFHQRVPKEAFRINGGPPWGGARGEWQDRAVGFNLDRVSAPLLLTAITPGSLLGEWEPFAGLLLQGKPAEMVLIPDGVHVLVKPWERMTSQQGAVDWYRFWLKGEEDPDPAKGEQYARWRELRKLQHHQVAGDTTDTKR